MSDDEMDQAAPERSLLRRYTGPVILGIVLGVGLLYVLSRFAGSASAPQRSPEDARRAEDAAKLRNLDPELVVTEPAEPPTVAAGEYVEPPECPDGVENADCLLATLDSEWRVAVGGLDVPSGGEEIRVPVGSRLQWQVVSEQRGLLTSFLVEDDGGVLLIYPSPAGEMPVLEVGIQQPAPPPEDRNKMTWSRPGLRRVFALVSTTPFVAPQGQAAGRVATYYAPGEASTSFFAELRNQVYQDQVGGAGSWALGEARFQVSTDPN